MDSHAPIEPPVAGSRISYAQNGEDILLDRVFRGRPGTFLDVGANHPFVDSNTYYFYVRGWRGVSVEPTPRGHALFERYRPEDRNLAVAVSDGGGELPFYEVVAGGELTGLSSLSAEVVAEHRARGLEIVEHRVPVRTVASLVAEHGIEPPDLLTIDVEQHEAAVLRGIPWASWRPKVLVIESTAPLTDAASHAGWEPMLLEHGYLLAAFNGVNRFYLRDDLRDELEVFATPVNALDGYIKWEVIAAHLSRDEARAEIGRLWAEMAAERVRTEELRSAWQWGQAQAQHAQAVWEQECASFARERVSWAAALEHFERTDAWFKEQQAAFERERAAWQAERERHAAAVAAARSELRPYLLLDRLHVVPAGVGWARRLKRRLVAGRG